MKQIKITLLPGKGYPMDIVVEDEHLEFVTKMLDNKQGIFTNIGYIEGADVSSYTVNDYIQPDTGDSPALKGDGGNENI